MDSTSKKIWRTVVFSGAMLGAPVVAADTKAPEKPQPTKPGPPADQIAAFQDTLRRAGADWEMNYYGNAVHSFTNEKADGVGIKGVAYHKPTADRSWAAMRAFFGEIFGETGN